MALNENIPRIALGTSHIIHDNRGQWLRPDFSSHHDEDDVEEPRFSEAEFRELIRYALDLGYRHFDCAPIYGTQKLVGECLAQTAEMIPRQRLFITSKLPPNMMRPENVMRSITQTIQDLRCSYLDLFLVHGPFATEHVSDDNYYPVDEEGYLLNDDSNESALEDTWRELVKLKKLGLTRLIGLSNVNADQIIRLHSIHPIDVVQNEYHIYNQNRELFDFCEELDIHYEAFAAFGSPFKSMMDLRPNCLSDANVRRIAKSYGLTPAEAIIQWLHTQPLSYVLRCDTKRQLEENFNASQANKLAVSSLIELDSLDKKIRVHNFEEHQGITRHREYPFRFPNMMGEDPSVYP